ncbi:MAG TPA: dienelactone hydrolase family protein [Streptosporangiaceae bacterium]|jgi:carboxymethylenebutenolidase
MRRLDVQIPTPDGHSNGTLHVPAGTGSWPGVLVFPDAGGSRETFRLARPEVTGSAIGITGYCLGGRMSLIAAGGLDHKIAAAASFHGGRLAVGGDPSSPHLAADRITATVYVAGATDDGSFTPEQAELLESALTEAGVNHTLEIYPGRHGFAVPDNPTYDAEADARHWEVLHELYEAQL